MKTIAFALVALPALALANPPEACSIVKIDDINTIVNGAVTKTRQQASGNPTACAFLDSKQGAVLVVKLREVQYAAEGELQTERESLEKIYRAKVKAVEALGDRAYWLGANGELIFRKGKTLVSVKFGRKANQNEVDTAQVARMVESRLK